MNALISHNQQYKSSRWKRVPLGEVVEFVYGKSLPKRTRGEGVVPVYGSNGIAGLHNTALVHEPTVIVGRKGTAGAIQLVNEPCYPIDTTYYTRIRPGYQCDVQFLAFALRTLNLSRLKTSTGVPGLNREDAYRELIPLPPLDEQIRVVELLSRAENIVRMRREAEAKAKEIIPALFIDMFGDPATNPKGWETKTLGDLVVNLDGARKPVKSSDRAGMTGENPYYGASGIIDYVSGHTHDVNALLVAEDGANLISRSTPIAFQATGKYWVNNHAHVLGQSRAANLTYLEVNLNLKDLRDSITGSAQPKLTQAALFKLPVMLPPIRNQEGFARHVSNVRLVSADQSESMRKAEGAFQSLLAGVFGG